MAFVRMVVYAYTVRGLDPAQALQQAQIAPQDVKNQQARVTAAQFEALNAHAMQELDDEALGWFSRRLPWGSYGMLCRASLGAPNLGVALKRWCRHHRLLTSDIVLDLRVADGVATMSITENRPLGEFREFCLVSSLRFVLGYACWAIDSRIALRAARFPFAAPGHSDAYPLMFPGTVQFGAAQASVSLTRSTWPCRCSATNPRCAPCSNAPCPSPCCSTAATACWASVCGSCCARHNPYTPPPPTGWLHGCTCPAARCTGSCWKKGCRCRP